MILYPVQGQNIPKRKDRVSYILVPQYIRSHNMYVLLKPSSRWKCIKIGLVVPAFYFQYFYGGVKDTLEYFFLRVFSLFFIFWSTAFFI